MPSSYIQKRRRRWYAVLEIPVAVRGYFTGKPRFVQSLQTESESEAHRRALPLIAVWKRRIAEARGATPEVSEAAFWRNAMARAKDAEERDLLSIVVDNRAEEIEEAKGLDTAKRFVALAHDRVKMIEPLADAWLAEAGYPEKGTYQHKRTLALLYTRHTTVDELDRRKAGAFVTEVLTPGRSPDTINRMISTYSQLWKWMMKRGHVDANPWSEQGVSKRTRNGNANGDSKRRGFTETEGSAFLEALSGVDKDVVSVAAVTGMRLEEITALLPADVERHGNVVWLNVVRGKTAAAAARRVPVVDASVRKMLMARKAQGKERVFHELEADRFGDYGSALSKRVGRKLRAIGLTDAALVADHSWRHRARTLMERADVQPSVADALLGHARPGEGLGRYSAGPSDAQLVAAIKAVGLPRP